ncbi:MAG: hypothetical protein RL698_1633 [Pseudomonadota bacterium]
MGSERDGGGGLGFSPGAARRWNCRLTTIGRRTGRPRKVTLWWVPDGARVLLAGGADEPQWCRNLRRDAAVEIEVGGETRRGRARLVDDSAAADAIRDRFVERYLLARAARLFGGYTRSHAVVVDLEAPVRGRDSAAN